jgi:hypothetical protein
MEPPDRSQYRAGYVEYLNAEYQYLYFDLHEKYLVKAEKIARRAYSRYETRLISRLHANWRLDRGEFGLAIHALRDTVRLARSAGLEDPHSEALLALARVRVGDKTHAREEAERLSTKSDESALAVAQSWQALGEHNKAVEHALRAHRWALADCEPYVRRWELDKTRALLTELGADLPPVSQFDPAKHPPLPWEKNVLAAIEKLRGEKKHK